jgi:hypothetical protein
MSKPNIFISWSGERSRFIADALRRWLPTVIQAASPWMSAKDIEKGTQGVQEIAHALDWTRIGVICLTPENADERWILYEAGALSKTVNNDKTRICTLLLGGLTFQDVVPPLGNFQHTKPEKEEIWSLIQSINNALSDSPISIEPLRETFDAMWPKLEKQLQELPNTREISRPKRSPEEMLAEILDTVRGSRDTELSELRRELANKTERENRLVRNLATLEAQKSDLENKMSLLFTVRDDMKSQYQLLQEALEKVKSNS